VTLDDIKTLLDFHYWARDRALDAAAKLTPEQFMRDMGNSFKSVRDTIIHLYSADWGAEDASVPRFADRCGCQPDDRIQKA